MGIDSGLAGLHVTGVLAGESPAISRDYLTLGGQSLQD